MNWIDEKQRYVAEIAIFWDEIARNLPKCVERSALGDDVILQAVNVAYEKFRPHIKAQGTQEALAKVEEWVKKNGEVWSDYYKDGEYVPQIVVNADDLLHHLQQLKDNKEKGEVRAFVCTDDTDYH